MLAYSGVAQKDQAAQIRLGDARVRLRLSALVADAAAASNGLPPQATGAARGAC